MVHFGAFFHTSFDFPVEGLNNKVGGGGKTSLAPPSLNHWAAQNESFGDATVGSVMLYMTLLSVHFE